MSRLVTTVRTAETVTGAGFAAGFAAAAAPAAGTAGGHAYGFSNVRTFVTYAGAVTAARLRLYTRIGAVGTPWFRGASSDDVTALAPASGNQSQDWKVGAGMEFLFVLESVAPGTAGNTVAVDVAGVA